MHEASIVRALLDQVLALASAREAVAIESVHVRVGEFAGVEPALLASAWSVAVLATRAEGAWLAVETTPLTARCLDCGERFAPVSFRFVCPRCGRGRVKVDQGDEFILEAVDLRVTEEAGSCR